MIEVIGVDSHTATVAACAVDAAGRELRSREFANDPAGHETFASWIAEHAPQGCRIGVEGALGFAFALVEHLLGEGLEVVEVPAHLTRRETKYLHGQGRSDPRDALAIARVTLREHKLPALRPAGPNRSLKLVHDYRRQLTVERSRTANRLHADLHALYPGYRVRIPNLIRVRHLAAATRLLRGCPASRKWQGFGLGKGGGRRLGSALVDVERAVPGERLVRSDRVELDAERLGVTGQLDGV